MNKKFILLLLLSFHIQCAFSQQQCTTKGKDFWLGFMKNGDDVNLTELSVYISATQNTSGVLEIPGSSTTIPFAVNANSTIQLNIPNSTALFSTGIIENKGIHITAVNDISVFALNYREQTSDASLIFPTTNVGSKYRVLTIHGWSYEQGEEYLVVAIEDNSQVEITPVNGASTTINLNKGEAYQIIQSANLTGTLIEEVNGKKIAVFCGSVCDFIGNCDACDHLYEQMLPINRFGKHFITVPLATKAKDYFRILANYDNTQISINGSIITTLNAGEAYQFSSNISNYISCSSPVFIYQYAQGYLCDSVGDPFSVIVPPLEQSIEDITFNAFTSNVITDYYVNIVTQTAYTSLLLLDGNPVSFTPVPSYNNYSYAQVPIDSGTHQLYSPKGFLATVYGFGYAESYGYSAGFSMINLIDPPENIDVILELPNVITPNNDGSNDYFIPVNIEGIKSMNTTIYNRWGKIVYSTDKLNIEWDGKNNNQEVANGVYFYTCEYKGLNEKSYSVNGTVTVIN